MPGVNAVLLSGNEWSFSFVICGVWASLGAFSFEHAGVSLLSVSPKPQGEGGGGWGGGASPKGKGDNLQRSTAGTGG